MDEVETYFMASLRIWAGAITPHVQFVRVDRKHGDLMRAAEDLCQDFDVERETALTDIERWVSELVSKGLIHTLEPEAVP